MEHTKPQPQAMFKTDDDWTVCRFEFDTGEGRGTKWQTGRSTKDVEKMSCLFRDRGYVIVDWKEV